MNFGWEAPACGEGIAGRRRGRLDMCASGIIVSGWHVVEHGETYSVEVGRASCGVDVWRCGAEAAWWVMQRPW